MKSEKETDRKKEWNGMEWNLNEKNVYQSKIEMKMLRKKRNIGKNYGGKKIENRKSKWKQRYVFPTCILNHRNEVQIAESLEAKNQYGYWVDSDQNYSLPRDLNEKNPASQNTTNERKKVDEKNEKKYYLSIFLSL